MTKFKGPVGWVARTMADAWSGNPQTLVGVYLRLAGIAAVMYVVFVLLRN